MILTGVNKTHEMAAVWLKGLEDGSHNGTNVEEQKKNSWDAQPEFSGLPNWYPCSMRCFANLARLTLCPTRCHVNRCPHKPEPDALSKVAQQGGPEQHLTVKKQNSALHAGKWAGHGVYCLGQRLWPNLPLDPVWVDPSAGEGLDRGNWIRCGEQPFELVWKCDNTDLELQGHHRLTRRDIKHWRVCEFPLEVPGAPRYLQVSFFWVVSD